jgi:1-acyl-sn-glycerol-3-phosphate acyltransferase
MSITGGEVLYRLLKFPVQSYLKWQFNIQIEDNPLRDETGPYLLLGNHVTNEDPILSSAYANRLIRFIAGDANQDHWLKKRLLALLESIPFSKNAGDAKSIRELVRHIKKGHPVGLYPEGGRNWDGATDSLVPSTGKLVKLLKVPVYAVILKGGYLSRPRWAAYPRRGKLVLEIKKLFSREAIADKTPEEIQALLVEKLDHDEYIWQRKNLIPFKGKKLAERIERLLYICPQCHGINCLFSKGDHFSCRQCHSQYGVNQYGEIMGCEDFSDTVSWNKWQRSFLPEIIARGFSFANEEVLLSKKVIGVRPWRRHVVNVNFYPDRLEIRGKNLEERVPLAEVSGLSITFQDLVEFYRGKEKYRLLFDPQKHMSVKLFYDLMGKIVAE